MLAEQVQLKVRSIFEQVLRLVDPEHSVSHTEDCDVHHEDRVLRGTSLMLKNPSTVRF